MCNEAAMALTPPAATISTCAVEMYYDGHSHLMRLRLRTRRGVSTKLRLNFSKRSRILHNSLMHNHHCARTGVSYARLECEYSDAIMWSSFSCRRGH